MCDKKIGVFEYILYRYSFFIHYIVFCILQIQENTMASKLIQLLEYDYSPDYWSDVVILEAGDEFTNLDETGWKQLEAELTNRPPSWCKRLTDALLLASDINAEKVHTLLKLLLRREEVSIGTAAAAMLIETNYNWEPELSLVEDIDRHLTLANELEATPLRRLKSRLPYPYVLPSSRLPSKLGGGGPIHLEFPVPSGCDRDIATLLSNKVAMAHLLAMAKISTGGWSESDAETRRLRQEREFQDGTSLNGVVFFENQFAGIAGFRDINRWNLTAEMGIILHPEFWHKQISTYVHLFCLEYIFDVEGINRVEFKTASSNEAMKYFCSKTLKATHEGTMRDFFPTGQEDGSFEDAELYSLLAADWPHTKALLEDRTQRK